MRKFPAHYKHLFTDNYFFYYFFRFSQIGVVSYGEECPSVGVYARVTEVKHWIQSIARGALDSSCEKIEFQAGL